MSEATMSASSAAAWSGKSIVDATYNERPGQTVLNNSLGASHSIAGLNANQQNGDIREVINRGTSPIVLAASDSAANAKDRFATAITIPPSGKARLYYNGLTWEPYVDAGLPDYAVVASASTIVPTAAVMSITGTTGITAITGTNLKPGQFITLLFTASLTVTNAAGSLMLAGAANFSATADDALTLVWDGTKWREEGRSVN